MTLATFAHYSCQKLSIRMKKKVDQTIDLSPGLEICPRWKSEILLILIKDTQNKIYRDNTSSCSCCMTRQGRIWPTEMVNLT